MRKEHNKIYHDIASKKRYMHKLNRKDKKYKGLVSSDKMDSSIFNSKPKKRNIKELKTPEEFSFIYNIDESLEFFQDFMYYSEVVDLLKIDMRGTKNLTIEVLLYLISLHKINKNNNIKPSITIKAPKVENLKGLMAQSGFSKYFKARLKVEIDDYNIFQIQDKESNQKANIPDEETCKDAIDFALKFYNGAQYKDTKFKHMFNALAEMMTNTDDHAYDEKKELRNWYLFAIKLEKGISFFFFDNGKGVLKTAKKKLLEKAIEKIPFSYGHQSLMKSVLNGDYRSATGKRYRNKGLPEINDFLTNDTVSLPIILTNKIYSNPDKKLYQKIKHNFRGTLFVWVLKDEDK